MTVMIYFEKKLQKYVVEVRDGKGNLKGGNVFLWNEVSLRGLRYEIKLASPARYLAGLELASNSLSRKEGE